MTTGSDDLVLLAVAHDEVEARIWQDILEAEGIGVFLKNRDALASFGVPPFPGTIQVYVQARDEKRARWVLGEAAEPAAPPQDAGQAAEENPATSE